MFLIICMIINFGLKIAQNDFFDKNVLRIFGPKVSQLGPSF